MRNWEYPAESETNKPTGHMKHAHHSVPELLVSTANEEHHIDEEAKKLKHWQGAQGIDYFKRRLLISETVVKKLVKLLVLVTAWYIGCLQRSWLHLERRRFFCWWGLGLRVKLPIIVLVPTLTLVSILNQLWTLLASCHGLLLWTDHLVDNAFLLFDLLLYHQQSLCMFVDCQFHVWLIATSLQGLFFFRASSLHLVFALLVQIVLSNFYLDAVYADAAILHNQVPWRFIGWLVCLLHFRESLHPVLVLSRDSFFSAH